MKNTKDVKGNNIKLFCEIECKNFETAQLILDKLCPKRFEITTQMFDEMAVIPVPQSAQYLAVCKDWNNEILEISIFSID